MSLCIKTERKMNASERYELAPDFGKAKLQLHGQLTRGLYIFYSIQIINTLCG